MNYLMPNRKPIPFDEALKKILKSKPRHRKAPKKPTKKGKP